MKKGREELLLPHTEVLMEHGLTLIYAATNSNHIII